MHTVDADMVLVAKHRDLKTGRLERLGGGTVLHLGLGMFDRPAPIAIFLADLGGLRLPAPGYFPA